MDSLVEVLIHLLFLLVEQEVIVLLLVMEALVVLEAQKLKVECSML